jgi:hypothetical protein
VGPTSFRHRARPLSTQTRGPYSVHPWSCYCKKRPCFIKLPEGRRTHQPSPKRPLSLRAPKALMSAINAARADLLILFLPHRRCDVRWAPPRGYLCPPGGLGPTGRSAQQPLHGRTGYGPRVCADKVPCAAPGGHRYPRGGAQPPTLLILSRQHSTTTHACDPQPAVPAAAMAEKEPQ